MRLDLRHMRCFVVVAEELHFRRAAERLGIAQPALSRTIRDLENDLGAPLFERSNRFVRLTKAGAAFWESCVSILNAVDHAAENTKRVSEGHVGSLRIAYTDLAIVGPLPKMLKDLSALYPDVAFQFRNDVSINQVRHLEDDLLDIGFVTGPFSAVGYEKLVICKEKFVCIVYEGHPLAQRDTICISDIADEDFVHGTAKEWEMFYSHFNPLCHRHGFSPRIIQEAQTSIGILGLVAAGVGITVLTENVCRSLPQGTKLIPISDVQTPFETVAVWKTNKMDNAKRKFIDGLRSLVIARSISNEQAPLLHSTRKISG